MIELPMSANSNLIVVPAHCGARVLIFPVVTNFHKMDARVIAYIDHLGKLDGLVTHVLQRGFVMNVNVKPHDRRKLAAKIEWLVQHRHSEVREQRADSRFVPKDPYSRMILADGHVE